MGRILVAHPYPDRYGADQMLLLALEGFRDAGYDVSVAVPEPGPLLALLETSRIPYRDLAFPVVRKELFRPLLLARFLFESPQVVLRLAREIRATNPQVVYVNTITLPHWVIASRIAKVPVICHAREAEPALPAVAAQPIVLPASFASTLIANSHATEAFLRRSWHPPRDLRVIYNGVRVQTRGDRSRFPSGGRLRLAVVGRLNRRKGQDLAIRAVAMLRSEGVDAQLDVVGSSFRGYEGYEAELRKLAELLGVGDRVRFRGFAADVREIYESNDIALVPSRVESFGNAAAEAMAAGLPIIATMVGGLPELVRDGVTGLLVPKDDAAAIVGAVKRLLADPSLATRLAERAYAEIGTRFSTERYRRELVTVIEHYA